MIPSIPVEIARKRRYIRMTVKNRRGILGMADGTLYHPDGVRYWARWHGSKDANGNASYGQPFAVYPGDTNYLPQAGRQVYIGIGLNGKWTVKGAVLDDLVNAGFDPRALNPNDAYRQYIYTTNIVTFRSDALADEGNDTLKVNLNQLFYRDAYGQFNRWNGTDEDTHLDLADYATVAVGADEHQYALITLRTLENSPQVTVSTPKSAFIDLDFDDIQECISKADPECIDSRVYRIASDQVTLIASPVTDLDLRQWINVPPRLGNPTVITERLRVRANHQLIYYGEVQVLGELQVLGEVVLLGTGGDGSIDTSQFVTLTGTQTLTNKTLTAPTIADYTSAQHDHQDADDGGQLTGAAVNVTAHNMVIGNGASGLTSLAPSTARKVAISDGTDWTSRALVTDDLPVLGSDESTLNLGGDIVSNTTSFADVDATNLSLSLTTTTGRVQVGFNGAVLGAITMFMYFDILVDGVRYGGDDGLAQILVGVNATNFMTTRLITGLSDASHTLKLQWKMQSANNGTLRAGAGTAGNDTHPQFWVQEVL